MTQDHELFMLWFAEPLRALEKMPSGQGGFVALATACSLYERYAKASLSKRGMAADRPNLIGQLGIDFSVDGATADAFWAVIRDGILHQAMPVQKKRSAPLPRWAFHHNYPVMSLEEINGEQFLKVQPWKFMDRVLELWEANFSLLGTSGSFPWATIGPVPA